MGKISHHGVAQALTNRVSWVSKSGDGGAGLNSTGPSYWVLSLALGALLRAYAAAPAGARTAGDRTRLPCPRSGRPTRSGTLPCPPGPPAGAGTVGIHAD